MCTCSPGRPSTSRLVATTETPGQREQLGRRPRHRVEHVLAVVEDDQAVTTDESRDQLVERRLTRVQLHQAGRGNVRRDVDTAVDGREVDEEGAARPARSVRAPRPRSPTRVLPTPPGPVRVTGVGRAGRVRSLRCHRDDRRRSRAGRGRRGCTSSVRTCGKSLRKAGHDHLEEGRRSGARHEGDAAPSRIGRRRRRLPRPRRAEHLTSPRRRHHAGREVHHGPEVVLARSWAVPRWRPMRTSRPCRKPTPRLAGKGRLRCNRGARPPMGRWKGRSELSPSGREHIAARGVDRRHGELVVAGEGELHRRRCARPTAASKPSHVGEQEAHPHPRAARPPSESRALPARLDSWVSGL